ncbi:unnamed protein product [Soboliphyme baturini]|uniref:Uncharacterized protein n=1 Tax=Soboliphyme baturini TaxID=241478 RepID=A0A3P7ZW18_9BILA|nr:unnamed protein product [Soboliphyme baturini]
MWKTIEDRSACKCNRFHIGCVKYTSEYGTSAYSFTERHRQVLNELKSRFHNLRPHCFPRPKNGCKCAENGNEVAYSTDDECRIIKDHQRGKEIEEKAREGHKQVINELNSRFRDYREECFPRPKSGCRCTEHGKQVTYGTDAECRKKKKYHRHN